MQHAGNPVQWQPWSDEAFALARELDRPVFISIGYATCHWCHVMAHESFEDERIASYLNEHYVCIKVDREERPDVDGMYMDVCQAMTGHGGWPLTIFTDADRRSFFAGTYFPPRSQANRVGFIDLISRVHHAWSTDREQVLASAQEIVRTLQEGASADFRGDVPDGVFTTIAEHHQRTFDDTYGGFNVQPKFPSPHHLLLLFRIGRRTGNTELIRMATVTLNAMRAGGIYDQVGFGFHRYSTDREWLVPHFEKMLYDQAMLLMAYTEAWQITGNALYRQTAEEILAYLQREMTSTEGAFFSAQDADSEGVEGKYYVWSYSELQELVGTADAEWLREHLHARSDGNFHDEASGNATGLNILHWDVQGAFATNQEVRTRWTSIRTLLLEHRQQRVAPLTDDKILTDWNGLIIGALARAGRAFGAPEFTTAAIAAYDAVTSLCGGTAWVHRYRDGDRAVDAMLDDHAAMGWAGLELYQTSGEERYLKDAVVHADIIAEQFTDAQGALFISARRHSAELPVQQRDGFDSAYPCGNSMSAWLFAGLSVILDRDDYRERARSAVTTYGTQIERFAPGFCMLLCAWDVVLHGSTEIGVVGERTLDFVQRATTLIGSTFQPDAYLIWQPEEGTTLLSEQYPFAGAPSPSILVCKQYACQRPITSIRDLEDHLAGEAR